MSAWLFDSLLVTSALMGAILLIRGPVAKLFGAGVAYALWLIPAARLLMPSLTDETAPVGQSSQAMSDTVRESILAGINIAEPATTAIAGSPGIDMAALAITIWLGGAVLFFMIQMIRYASMRDDLLSGVAEITVIDGVSVVASDQVAGPLAFGLFKRFIAVPPDFIKAYSPAERELAIAHEMAHHKSGDLFANLAAFIVLCLQWFNPIAWMSWSAFRVDQEAACDARVLAGKCAEDRVIYGQALARTAFDGLPTFATALNSPKTIIERLRRLTMKDPSKQRRSFGKLGILTATAVILPLTATVVAQEAETTAEKKAKSGIVKSHVKVIKVKPKDDDTIYITTQGDDGKSFVFQTIQKASQSEIDRLAANAEKLAARNADNTTRSDHTRGGTTFRVHKNGKLANSDADYIHFSADEVRVSTLVPEIDIQEITVNCKEGQPVTTNVEGSDGTSKSRIKIVMCGKGQAKVARIEALEGLREARSEIASEEDMPKAIRTDVIEKLEKQIRKLEAEADTAG